MTDMRELSAYALDLATSIKPFLAGHPQEVQGAALAELMATYLQGHRVPGDVGAQEQYRKHVLEFWVEAVLSLVAVDDMTHARKQ